MTLSAVLIGHQSLAQQCGQMWLDAGHRLGAVVTRHPGVRDWAEGRGLTVVAPGKGLADRIPACDWILSVANLDLLPEAVLARAARGGSRIGSGLRVAGFQACRSTVPLTAPPKAAAASAGVATGSSAR